MRIKFIAAFIILCLPSLSNAYTGDLPFTQRGTVTLDNRQPMMGFIRSNVKDFKFISLSDDATVFDVISGQQNWHYHGYYFEKIPFSQSNIALYIPNEISGTRCNINITYVTPTSFNFTVRDGKRTRCGMDAEGNISYYIF